MYNEFDKEEFMTDEEEMGDPKKNSGLIDEEDELDDEPADGDLEDDGDDDADDPKVDEEEEMM